MDLLFEAVIRFWIVYILVTDTRVGKASFF